MNTNEHKTRKQNGETTHVVRALYVGRGDQDGCGGVGEEGREEQGVQEPHSF